MLSDRSKLTCRACGKTAASYLQSGTLIGHSVQYYECAECRYVQADDPHWLTEAYSNAITSSDTGILARNVANARITLGALLMLGGVNGKVVDCAGGYGILVRLLRDQGIDAYWSDPFCSNLVARGFEHDGQAATLVTAFEAFEHFVEPTQELEKMLRIAPHVLLSTEIMPQPSPAQGDWWYFGVEHGQHIGFFRVKTLEALAARFGKYLVTDGRSYHLLTDRKTSPAIWKLSVRLNGFIPYLARGRPASKTWTDHLKMSKRDIK